MTAGAAPQRPRDGEVLAAAANVFSRRGYAAATVQDVADELGILKGSLYYYTRTKEDLLFRLLSAVHDDVDALLEAVAAIEGLTPLERLSEYVRRQAAYNLRNLVRITIYYNDLDQLRDERRREMLRRRRQHEDFVTGLIEEGQRGGEIDPAGDPRLLARTVFAVILWPYRWFRPRGRLRIEEVAESCVAFVRGALAGG
jgi:TetR/AcrR family transcriptional regulator, cholesterol catabolism regulator